MEGESRERGGGGDAHHEITPKSISLSEINSFSFREISNNPSLPLFFIIPPYKLALQGMEFYEKFVNRFQDLSKARNAVVTKAKV